MVNPFEQTAVAGKKRGYAKPRWTDRFSATVDKGRDIGSNMLPGAYGVAMKGLEALTEGVAMANENERWFKQNAPNAQRYAGVPINVRESVQTDRDKNFFNKYMNLAAMAQDSDKKQWYLDQADTARRNLQITKRINYGLGQMDLDETPFEGYESYDQGFEGFGPQDLGPRFDIDRFSEAMSEYLPGGEDITEDITETIRSPHDIETEDAYSGFPGGFVDDRIVTGPFPPGIAYPGYNEDITITDLIEDTPEEDIQETTETFTDLDDTHEFTDESSWYAGSYTGPQEYVNALTKDPDSTWYKMDQDELVEILIKQNRIKEK